MLRLDGPGKAAQQALATDLLRWFMPQVFFYGVTALATAMLNARRRFAAAAFAPVLNNVVVIAVAARAAAGRERAAHRRRASSTIPALVRAPRARDDGRHRGDGARPAARAPPRRGPHPLGLGVAPPRRPPPRPALGLDDRLRRDEPGRVLGRAVPRLRPQRRRVRLPRRVHVLPAARTACSRSRS